MIVRCGESEGLTKDQFLEFFTVKIPALRPGQTPKPLDLDEDGDGMRDQPLSGLSRIETTAPEPAE